MWCLPTGLEALSLELCDVQQPLLLRGGLAERSEWNIRLSICSLSLADTPGPRGGGGGGGGGRDDGGGGGRNDGGG